MDYITSESIISLFLSAASDVHHGRKTIKAARAHIAKNMHAYTEQVIGSHDIERIRFYADRVANTKTTRKTAFWDLMMSATIEVREEARAMAVLHQQALEVNESYDETPECPNSNRLYHAVARIYGRNEADSYLSQAERTPRKSGTTPNDVVAAARCLCMPYAPFIAALVGCNHDSAAVAWSALVDVNTPDADGLTRIKKVLAALNASYKAVTKPDFDVDSDAFKSELEPSEVRFTADDGRYYSWSLDEAGAGQLAELIGSEWHFVCALDVEYPTQESIWAAYLADTVGGAFDLLIGSRLYHGFTDAVAARNAYNQLRDDSGKGASEWTNGAIKCGDEIVFLSYNGRAWPTLEFSEIGQEIVLTRNTAGF
ncbi:hypothetical protein MA12_gp21 [Pectobacterium phage MA12]|uniref:Uncharacterized protein n=1 Tax=Pectobacterium phage MA12 TaxID=2686474 RepID=A0A6B9RH25_9CAUD|nr:hypothetical protein JT356_gp05 [Pectobacterium phage MA11]YP_010000243.1 hypothetical protein JT357_gp21 [Pectobacterium phage MA12]QGF21030.1 hypothetical protein MA11_gp05 [Pectobacterium phage MA11]QHI00848.1 hypothetical protein MA12_gp21 [Pectobacterium phage MA12]